MQASTPIALNVNKDITNTTKSINVIAGKKYTKNNDVSGIFLTEVKFRLRSKIG